MFCYSFPPPPPNPWNHQSFYCLRVCVCVCVCVCVLVTQLCPTLCNPMDCSPPGSSVYGDSPGKNTGVGCQCPPPGYLPNPGIKTRSPTLQTDSLLSEPPENAKNTGVGSPSLLQGDFLTQELKQGLLFTT